ncbi:MAG TPA: D-alanyl-D-alanine carboxypeptidase/D-alanyl-D-alanine-endopeptidase [Planctomycetota bacterium]|nr:D-alanyl-D-alanine carboxypeptidase/D-alanyl-D-alanine-endopeptidase [Planctomycetota bacterium]
MPPLLALLLACLLLPRPLADGVETQLHRGELKGAHLAVCVVDVDSGERLYARDIDAPMAPASNMKVVTTAAALSLLGANHVFATRLLALDAPDARGVLAGDLVVLGGADPCLREDLLAREGVDDPAELLADLVEAAGIRRVEGRLLLDDGLLDRQWLNPDWKGGDIGSDYAAPIGALSIHGNCLSLDVSGGPPSATLATLTRGFRVVDELQAAGSPRTYEVGALRPDGQGLVRVKGSIGSAIGTQRVRVPVIDPASYFGQCLLATLLKRGVVVRDGLAVEAGAAARAPHELGRLESPLVNAVLVALKESDNGLADHMFKYLGAQRGGEGSFAGGERAVLAFLCDLGTPSEGVVLRDGSGLSGRNRVTARLMTDVLATMARRHDAAGDAFLRSLPVAGLDGSLRDRMEDPPLQGAVRAKTGYISGVSTLSGFARTQAGRTLAFSVLINDFDPSFTNRQMKDIQDDLCRALVTQH